MTVTSWDVQTVTNSSVADEDLLSSIVGVHVTDGGNDNGHDNDSDSSGDTDASDIDAGFSIAIEVNVDTDADGDGDGEEEEDSPGFRERVSCKYYDTDRRVWTLRGVFLRGIGVVVHDNSTISALAICVSSHLTLFSVQDASEAVQVVADKVNGLANRVTALGDVDLFAEGTIINWPVLLALGIATLLFLVIATAASVRAQGRRAQVVTEARHVYVQRGILARPAVVGSDEYEAILRGSLSAGQVAKMVLLDVTTRSPFLGLFFRWSHEAIVFTAVDKASILYVLFLPAMPVFFMAMPVSMPVPMRMPSHNGGGRGFGFGLCCWFLAVVAVVVCCLSCGSCGGLSAYAFKSVAASSTPPFLSVSFLSLARLSSAILTL